jgi:hypothetical protein
MTEEEYIAKYSNVPGYVIDSDLEDRLYERFAKLGYHIDANPVPGIHYFIMKEGEEDVISGDTEVEGLWTLEELEIFLTELEGKRQTCSETLLEGVQD